MAGLESIKRAARNEAWYSDSWNPFRKNMKRSSTWAPPSPTEKDIETGRYGVTGGVEGVAPSRLSPVQTEPTGHGPPLGDETRRGSKQEEYQMTTPSGSGEQREADSQDTVVGSQSTRPESQEVKARKRFISKYFNRGNDNDDGQVEESDAAKKRPWYKGKVLKHKPFTLWNQLRATIFNSYINILLLAAPVGIALNYAKVDGKIVFVVNFIAIIPLAAMLSFATEEISLHVGESLGGLLNASFG